MNSRWTLRESDQCFSLGSSSDVMSLVFLDWSRLLKYATSSGNSLRKIVRSIHFRSASMDGIQRTHGLKCSGFEQIGFPHNRLKHPGLHPCPTNWSSSSPWSCIRIFRKSWWNVSRLLSDSSSLFVHNLSSNESFFRLWLPLIYLPRTDTSIKLGISRLKFSRLVQD